MSDNKKLKFSFGKILDDELAQALYDNASLDPDKLYRQALLTKKGKQALYQKALEAALKNLMSWERAAVADGFEVVPVTDMFLGCPRPVIKGDEVHFVQCYGVQVRLAEEEE